MTNNRGLKNRKTISNAVRTELAEALKQLSEVTKIPMSKLLDEALEDLINKYANSTEKQGSFSSKKMLVFMDIADDFQVGVW